MFDMSRVFVIESKDNTWNEISNKKIDIIIHLVVDNSFREWNRWKTKSSLGPLRCSLFLPNAA